MNHKSELEYGAPLRIDLRGILRARMSGWKRALIPGALLGALERLVHQEELNQLLKQTYPAEGSAFAEALLRALDITIDIRGTENIPDSGRFLFVSNHPLGGLDGVALLAVLGRRYGDDHFRCLVNDLLLNVRPLSRLFLSINKYGSQARKAARIISEAYASDMQLLQFPAGLVSRLHDDGTIHDLTWQKSAVVKAIESGRDIIPVRFEATNSMRFYRTARWRRKLGLKINIEQALLPGEMCKARGSRYTVIFGAPVSHARLRQLTDQGERPAAIAENLRELSDSLK